jgi:hypothetical protein
VSLESLRAARDRIAGGDRGAARRSRPSVATLL